MCGQTHDPSQRLDGGICYQCARVDKQEKTRFCHIVIDSNSGPERLFAQACEDHDDALFYIKLPRWFQIQTS